MRLASKRERVLAMRELWTKEEAEFHGEYVNFDPVWLYPKPKQNRTLQCCWAVRATTASSVSWNSVGTEECSGAPEKGSCASRAWSKGTINFRICGTSRPGQACSLP